MRRRILSRPRCPGRIRIATGAVLALSVPAIAAASPAPQWNHGAPMPAPRGEVAAALVAGEIAVVGGFLANGGNSPRVDAYSPARDTWRRLPDLPASVDHAMAAASSGRLYVLGGYGVAREKRRSAWVLERRRWRPLPRLPAGRAAGGAAVIGSRLYVVGGVGPNGLARVGLVFDLRRRRWSTIPGPTPREHLAVTALGGRLYALAGRRAGFDTNLTTLESYTPGARSWRALPPIPDSRGGTAAAALAGQIVSAGGEEQAGTIGAVYAYTVATRRWRRLPDLPTPRHGLGVVAALGRVYALAGGREPGLAVSSVNEFLEVR